LCESAHFGQSTQIREHNIIHGIVSYGSITEQETSAVVQSGQLVGPKNNI